MRNFFCNILHIFTFLFLYLFQLEAETNIEVVWFIEVEVVLPTDDQQCWELGDLQYLAFCLCECVKGACRNIFTKFSLNLQYAALRCIPVELCIYLFI